MRERFIVGSLGSVRWQNALESLDRWYCAWRLEFKFESEHRLEGEAYEMEVLVYHYSSESREEGGGCSTHYIVDQYTSGMTQSLDRQLLAEHTQMVVSFLVRVEPS